VERPAAVINCPLKVKRHTTIYAFALAGLLALAAAVSHAQKYPNRPVRILVPLAAGGGMDTVTRGLALQMTDTLGQSVVVDNRPGAGSQVALEIMSSAAPNGYTLMMLSATTVVYPMLYKSRFDIVRDFAPVSQVTAQGYVLVVHPSLPGTMPELVKYVRANPGKLNYASSGIGSPIHMSTVLFELATGTKMVHVPYKGMGAAYGDLLGGRINLSFATIISSMVHIKSGRLCALAVTTPKRAPALPEVPTFAEAGVKGVVVVNWYGLVAPKGTAKPIIDLLANETIKAARSPEMAKRLVAEGSEAAGTTPTEFTAHLRAEHAMWSKVIREGGIKGE
jgi:tripartite-type tricarboxylate transporter receptor subunit TctC